MVLLSFEGKTSRRLRVPTFRYVTSISWLAPDQERFTPELPRLAARERVVRVAKR
jgi:hypothetical protein